MRKIKTKEDKVLDVASVASITQTAHLLTQVTPP